MIQKETVLQGLAISRGIAVARVCMFNEERHNNLDVYKVSGKGVAKEINRVKRARKLAGKRLDEVRVKVESEVGKAESEIFFAQRTILDDAAMQAKIVELIENETVNAETAIIRVLDEYESRIMALDNEYIRERSTDFGEVKRRMLDVLADMNPSLQCVELAHCQRGRNRIVVAEELAPSMTTDLESSHTLGFVTERGGINSHAAILARALGIPAVSSLPDIRNMLACGTEVLINGFAGEVTIFPSAATITRARAEYSDNERLAVTVGPVNGFEVMANISSVDDLDIAEEMQAEGVGLYRTEFELYEVGRPLTEDEQFERYVEVVKTMNGKPATFRLLDIGGDKPMPFITMPQEDNPYLGWRGARLLMDEVELLHTQARALARASEHGEVRVMYPMIVDLEQFEKMRDLFCKGLPRAEYPNLKHGVMFEVPSACLQADDIMASADFGSIGTNDLIQYLFAVDRNNEKVAYDYREDRSVLWSLMKSVAAAAASDGKPLSVCGEMAGNSFYAERFHEIGINSVSVSPRRIPDVRIAAGKLDLE
jgi:phosphotransferase system enzyme I (PtsI)